MMAEQWQVQSLIFFLGEGEMLPSLPSGSAIVAGGPIDFDLIIIIFFRCARINKTTEDPHTHSRGST